MYFKRLFLISCILPLIVFAEDSPLTTQFLDARIKDIDSFIVVMSQKIELAYKLKDFSQMSYLQHAYTEAKANKEVAQALKKFLDKEIQLKGTQVISKLQTEVNFIKNTDTLLDSLVDKGGKTPKGNKVLNKTIHEVMGVKKIPSKITASDARVLRQYIHRQLAITQHSTEALKYARDSSKFMENDAIKYIDDHLISLAHNTPENPFYDDMAKFITGKKLSTFPARKRFITNPFVDDLSAKPKEVLGMRPIARIQRSIKIKLPAQPPIPVSSQPGLARKALKFGAKTLRILPLIGEVWTRPENALLANAHALEEECITKRANALDTTVYVGAQYGYRGFGFLSFVPNLADSATPENIQTTLNFLLRSGCFDEYRIFMNKNKSILIDLGLLNDLSLFTDTELTKEEEDYEDLQIRLNPSRKVVE